MKWKVPFRMVYCNSFKEWVKHSIWCHFVIKIWDNLIDLDSDGFVGVYLENPGKFYEQYEWMIRRVNNLPPRNWLERKQYVGDVSPTGKHIIS